MRKIRISVTNLEGEVLDIVEIEVEDKFSKLQVLPLQDGEIESHHSLGDLWLGKPASQMELTELLSKVM